MDGCGGGGVEKVSSSVPTSEASVKIEDELPQLWRIIRPTRAIKAASTPAIAPVSPRDFPNHILATELRAATAMVTDKDE